MLRYNKFSEYLKNRFGCRVYKISLDAGFSCPNRDGMISRDGCLFCDPLGGSGRSSGRAHIPVEQQIEAGMSGLKKKYKAEKFIAYFQAYTNTYAPIGKLTQLYAAATTHKDIVGLAIATRPDCLQADALELIRNYTKKYSVWIELGIQSMHDDSLHSMERGHSADDSRAAIKLIKHYGIQVCAHLILGLPGESIEDMIQTARILSELGIDAVKLHMLYITRHSRLAEVYQKSKVKLLSQTEYIQAAVKVLENLRPEIQIQRLVSEASPDILVAPEWLKHKSAVIKGIETELEAQATFQGKYDVPLISS